MSGGMQNLDLTQNSQPTGTGNDAASKPEQTRGNFAGKRYARPRPQSGGAGSGSPDGSDSSGSPDDLDSSASASQNPSMSNKFGDHSKSGKSHARRRFSEQSHSLVSITRPIKLDCYADKLVLAGDDGDPANNKEIPLGGFVQDSVGRLENEIHERIGSWGMAGRGMQWHPIVVVNVAPEAAERYPAIERMLKADGLEVRNKNASASTSPVMR